MTSKGKGGVDGNRDKSSSDRGSAYDAFSSVDNLVGKQVLGSDGAHSWQSFRNEAKHAFANTDSRAPGLQVKRADRLGTGLSSLEEERRHENQMRKDAGEAQAGSGYTSFKRKHNQEEAISKKKRKQIEQRIRPDEEEYFIPSKTFRGAKFDYVFTTRHKQTGYYWDGMDSLKRLRSGGDEIIVSESDPKEGSQAMNEKPAKKSKKKKRKKESEPTIDSAVIDDDPGNPLEMVARRIEERNARLQRRHGLKGIRGKTKASLKLPPDWEEAVDKSTGKSYFFNRKTNEQQWERPSALPPTKGDEVSASNSLPDGWNESIDASSGKKYYYHENGETRWDRPT